MTKMEPFYQLRPRDNMRFGKGEVRGYFLTVFILTGFFICFGQEIIDNDISISESKPTLLLSHSRPHVNYLVLSSRILRPNTIYKVIVILLDESSPTKVVASISQNGVSLSDNEIVLKSRESRQILLKVPPDNSKGTAKYQLRVEGSYANKHGLVFEHTKDLEFSPKFLSIMISTNKAVFNAEHTIRMRIIMLTTSMTPYEGIADLFLLDPDGFVIRKWNSQELNVGVLNQEFLLPLYPKVGFWTIRVKAETQTEELRVKVEKHYLPWWEIMVVMPDYALDTDEYIEAEVLGTFIVERIAKGDVSVVWYAKKIDYQTPMYNDTELYREEYDYYRKHSHFYNSLYYHFSNREEDIKGEEGNSRSRTTFVDPYVNRTDQPRRPLVNEWTEIRRDFQRISIHRPVEPFLIYMEEIEAVMGRREGIQVRCAAQLREVFYNGTQPAFAETRIVSKKLRLSFLGDQPFVFKPGMLFHGQISILYNDMVPISPEQLENSELIITTTVLTDNGQAIELPNLVVPPKGSGDEDYFEDSSSSQDYDYYDETDSILQDDREDERVNLTLHKLIEEQSFKEFREFGVHQFKFEVPPRARRLKLEASFVNEELGRANAETIAYGAYSKSDNFIKVTSNTKQISVGRFVVFHVKTNFPFEHLDWLVMSKDIITVSGRELGDNVHAEVKTFSVVVSSDMAPGFHMIVHTATLDKEIVSDSLYVPVDAIKSHEIEFKTNQVKDHLKLSVEITLRGDPGAVFMLATMREFTFPAQGITTITKANLLRSLHKFDKRRLHHVLRTSRQGERPDEAFYYSSMDQYPDTSRSFEAANLILISNALSPSESPQVQECDPSLGERPCLDEGCFLQSQLCDGVKNCLDGFDERGCSDPVVEMMEQINRYRLSRQSRFEDFYDIYDGDWGWVNTNIDEDGEQFLTMELPETPDDFYFHVFSLSKEHGIGIVDRPPSYSTTRPVDFYCEAPLSVHRGESVGVRCNLINRTPYELEAFIILRDSPDYDFIHVEEFGYVVSYAPRRSSGDHHHFLWLRPDSETEIYTPIAPKVEKGEIEVNFELSTQMTIVYRSVPIEILPEGSIVHRHTSVLLDLKNRANVLEFMNVIVDETPMIPYEVFRRFVSGSPRATVSICGDVIGPIFPNDEPVSLESIFPTGNGRFGKGTEYHAFNLALNTLQLHYLRLTNQLNDYRPVAKTVFQQINVEFAAVMRRVGSDGSARNWDDSAPSVWLTAWVIKILSYVGFQDWEDFIYTDPMIFSSAVLWLLNYQDESGAFFETSAYAQNPFHHPMKSVSPNNASHQVPLTAHVLIALEETSGVLQGKSKQFASSGKARAMLYLERNLPSVTDAYELAITTYALALAKSSLADIAYGKMKAAASVSGGGMNYWGRTEIKTNRVRYEFNRPFMEAKDQQDNDALAVEATGYALSTIFLMEGGGVTFQQEKIVEWLNTMRLNDGGFISTVDTIVASQALVLYSYHSRIKDITDLTVEVDLPDSNFTSSYHIMGDNGIARDNRIDLENVWGHLNLVAHGAGQAVAQMDLSYGIDFEPFKDHPPTECFNLKIKEHFSGRNKSEIRIDSCFSWSLTQESPTSGIAMLVVDIPTGYVIEQPEANRVVRSGQVPEMRDADVTRAGKTIWYFDRVPNKTRCFSHTVRRYFPIANLTRTRQAIILEPLRPERFFISTFNATSLYILSICEVCGSYQCPYCPFYSLAVSLHHKAEAAAMILISIFVTRMLLTLNV